MHTIHNMEMSFLVMFIAAFLSIFHHDRAEAAGHNYSRIIWHRSELRQSPVLDQFRIMLDFMRFLWVTYIMKPLM